MHIEPGVVTGTKLALSYATALGSLGLAAKLAFDMARKDGVVPLVSRSVMTTALVFCFFQILPHYPAGVSEVHFILGSTLFLIFGAGPAAIGLALGLLAQGLLFALADLPQYGMNVTSLLAPLYAVNILAKRVIPETIAYKDLTYSQTLALSTAYQGGVVAWVALWAFYGNGFSAENLDQVSVFGAAYLTVLLAEPLFDLAVLRSAKAAHQLKSSTLFHARLSSPIQGISNTS